jgi:hypothetical protein
MRRPARSTVGLLATLALALGMAPGAGRSQASPPPPPPLAAAAGPDPDLPDEDDPAAIRPGGPPELSVPPPPGGQPPLARVVVTRGQVSLQGASGRSIPVPGKLNLRDGDVLTTSAKVEGRIVQASGAIPLAPLMRYLVRPDGIYGPAGAKGWKKIPRSIDEAPHVRAAGGGGAGPGGLLAKVRVLAGQGFQRAAAWPQELPIPRSVSLSAGDDVRLDREGLAQVQFVSGGWIYLKGPALATFHADSVDIDSGDGLVKALGRAMALGPFRIDAGASTFSFRTVFPDALEVTALGGILKVRHEERSPTYLAPGRRALLAAGAHDVRITGVDIRAEIKAYEERFNPRGPKVAAAPERKDDPNRVLDAPARKADRRPGGSPDRATGEPRRRAAGPKEPRVADPRAVVLLPLRDRLRALDGPRSRYFYILKRDRQRAAADAATYRDDLRRELAAPGNHAARGPDEVQALRQFKLDRAHARAAGDIDDFRNSRELAFEARLGLRAPEKDRAIRAERERLFGEPLFLVTRRLLPAAEASRAQAIRDAEALSRQILILEQTGGSAAAIQDLARRRQDILTAADKESDALEEEIRIQAEPYR